MVCVVFVTAATVFAGGGGNGRVVLPLTIDAAPLTPVDAQALRSPEAAVRGIAAILTKSFGLTVPAHVTVYLYAGRNAFEQGLINDGRVTPFSAAELSDFAVGIGRRRQLLLNERPDQSDRERLRLIAHELTHVSQIELAGGEARGEQWLAEGMAEWVAYSTLERLGLDTMSRRRATATGAIRKQATLLQTRLDLEKRGTPSGFTVWHRREGSRLTYQLAFLMADYLIERQGFEKVRAYFASFADSPDRRANFSRASGETLEQFEADVLAHLRAISADDASPAGPPREANAPAR